MNVCTQPSMKIIPSLWAGKPRPYSELRTPNSELRTPYFQASPTAVTAISINLMATNGTMAPPKP